LAIVLVGSHVGSFPSWQLSVGNCSVGYYLVGNCPGTKTQTSLPLYKHVQSSTGRHMRWRAAIFNETSLPFSGPRLNFAI